MRRKFLIIICALAFAAPSWAQTLFQGRIDATILDAQGNAVPGVLVEIAGPTPMSQTTDSSGEARFLNLSPGVYNVTAALTGFNTYRNANVEVGGGRSVPLKITLQVSGVTEAVQVTAESLVVDPGRQTITTNVNYDQLQKLPSSRDPWVVLQTIPGVVVDRVNVGGAESGQQSNVLAKRAGTAEHTWNLDGIPVPDLRW